MTLHFQEKGTSMMTKTSNGNGNMEKCETGDKNRPKLDDRFITTIQGKEFVVYAGLLDLAHQKGLTSVTVEAIQYPTNGNGFEAICKATVESQHGDTYSEVGDANPKNVNPKVVKHILRVAATRAKARALRDYTNIGMTCLEELGDLDEITDDERNGNDKPRRSSPNKSPETPKDKGNGNGQGTAASNPPDPTQRQNNDNGRKQSAGTKPSEKPVQDGTKQAEGTKQESSSESSPKPSVAQVRAIENLARRRNISSDELEEMAQNTYGTSVVNLTPSEASGFIRQLQQSA
jgi:hypothetical protein